MKTPSTYRAVCAPIIARVLRETQGLPEAEVRARLLAAYPFGERVNQPYKIWREEIRKQGGPISPGRPSGARSTEAARQESAAASAGPEEPPPAAGRTGHKGGLVVTSEPWFTPPVRCRTCAHLGSTRPVIDCRGARRIRRHCDRSPCGFTDIDWTACAHYQLRDNLELPR